MHNIIILLLTLSLVSACSCNSNEAPHLLQQAERLFEQGKYNEAKIMVDSLRNNFPDAFEEIKSAIALFREIELAEQLRSYNYCDSMGSVLTDQITDKKRQFVYQRDKVWESEGSFYPRGSTPDDLFQDQHLRCSVMDGGNIRLVSFYTGSHPISHTSIRVSAPDKTHATTPAIPYDKALNFRFKEDDTYYEFVTFENGKEKEVINFIVNHPEDSITVTYLGLKQTSFVMNEKTIKSVLQCYELAALIADRLAVDSNKKKALQRINYLKMKEAGIPIRRQKPVTEEEYESMNR